MGKEEKMSVNRDMNKDEKLKALDAALTQIEKAYGKGSVMKLGESGVNMNIETVPTGSISLDIALGLGGVPKGRIIEIYGPGKSRLGKIKFFGSFCQTFFINNGNNVTQQLWIQI